MIKLALHSVSYSGTWGGQAVLPVERVVSKAVEFGYDGIELMAKRPHVSPLDYQGKKRKELRELIESSGLEVAAVAAYNDFANPTADVREKELLFLKETIGLTSDLGAPVLRIFGSGMGEMHPEASFDQQWVWSKEGIEEAIEHAEQRAVVLGLQNHTPVMQTYKNVLDMAREIGSDHLKVTLDAPLLDRAGESVCEAVREAGDLIVHSHTSDHTVRPGPLMRVPGGVLRPLDFRAVPLGEGQVDLRTFVSALKGVGYQGYLAYEVCGPVVGGGGEKNLDRCAIKAVEYMRGLIESRASVPSEVATAR